MCSSDPTANVQPRTIVAAIENWGTEKFADLQSEAKVIRALFQALPMIPALKYVVGEQMRDQAWRHVRAPLAKASDDWGQKLVSDLSAQRFSMVN